MTWQTKTKRRSEFPRSAALDTYRPPVLSYLITYTMQPTPTSWTDPVPPLVWLLCLAVLAFGLILIYLSSSTISSDPPAAVPSPSIPYYVAAIEDKGVAAADRLVLRVQVHAASQPQQMRTVAQYLLREALLAKPYAAVIIFFSSYDQRHWTYGATLAAFDYLPPDNDWISQGHDPDYTHYRLSFRNLRQ